MSNLIKKYVLYLMTIQQLFFLKAAVGIEINEAPDYMQENKQSQNIDKLAEMKKRHQAERNNLERTYKKKEQDLENERTTKKQLLTTTSERVHLSDPVGKRGKTTSQADKVDDYYDNQLKKLKEERKQKMQDLKDKQYAQHDAEVQKQLAANDALNAAFKADVAGKSKSQQEEKSSLAKGIEANKKYSKVLQKLKEAYENKVSGLDAQYKANWDRLNKKKEFASNVTTITIDNKVMTSDQAEQYYVDKMNDLKTKLDTEKKQALNDYNEQKQAQQQALEQEARNIFKTNPDDQQVSQNVMGKDLSQVTPRQIEKFVNQFAKDVIPDLTPKQKQSLRDVMTSLQEQVGSGESITTILENDRENIAEKLQLSTSQKTTFAKNYATIDAAKIDKTGFFEALLELLGKILNT